MELTDDHQPLIEHIAAESGQSVAQVAGRLDAALDGNVRALTLLGLNPSSDEVYDLRHWQTTEQRQATILGWLRCRFPEAQPV